MSTRSTPRGFGRRFAPSVRRRYAARPLSAPLRGAARAEWKHRHWQPSSICALRAQMQAWCFAPGFPLAFGEGPGDFGTYSCTSTFHPASRGEARCYVPGSPAPFRRRRLVLRTRLRQALLCPLRALRALRAFWRKAPKDVRRLTSFGPSGRNSGLRPERSEARAVETFRAFGAMIAWCLRHQATAAPFWPSSKKDTRSLVLSGYGVPFLGIFWPLRGQGFLGHFWPTGDGFGASHRSRAFSFGKSVNRRGFWRLRRHSLLAFGQKCRKRAACAALFGLGVRGAFGTSNSRGLWGPATFGPF